MLSNLINVFKKVSMQTKPENFKYVCSKIIIYGLEKVYKVYIFSTMYKKCNTIFIPPFILFIYFTCCSSTTHKIYLSIMKNHKLFRRQKSENKTLL